MDLGVHNFQSGGHDHSTKDAVGLRGVGALVLVGGRPETERFGEFPLALLDVLGRSVLMRTLDRIRAAGVGEIAVLSDADPLPPRPPSDSCKFSVASPASFWAEALQEYRRLGRQSECVLVLRLGAWAEVDFRAMLHEHRHSASAVTRACWHGGKALDIFLISSGSQAEAAALLRGELRDGPITATEHKTDGYVNWLQAPADLRAITLDAFAGISEIRPCGRELRPGVWVGKRVRIHRSARVVAPTFIGSFCNVRGAAVVTRGSSLEHHTEVDCATVIDNSSVMPYTRIGAGLDVEYSVVGFQQIHSLRHKAIANIDDPHLIAATTTHFHARMVSAVGWLANFLPNSLGKLLFEPRCEPAQGSAAKALMPLGEPPLAITESKTKSYQGMAATRGYGNE